MPGELPVVPQHVTLGEHATLTSLQIRSEQGEIIEGLLRGQFFLNIPRIEAVGAKDLVAADHGIPRNGIEAAPDEALVPLTTKFLMEPYRDSFGSVQEVKRLTGDQQVVKAMGATQRGCQSAGVDAGPAALPVRKPMIHPRTHQHRKLASGHKFGGLGGQPSLKCR